MQAIMSQFLGHARSSANGVVASCIAFASSPCASVARCVRIAFPLLIYPFASCELTQTQSYQITDCKRVGSTAVLACSIRQRYGVFEQRHRLRATAEKGTH